MSNTILAGRLPTVQKNSGVEHLARSLRPCGWGDLRIAMLTAYFDGSGHEADHPVLVVGGFISSAEDWALFEPQWLQRLAQERLEYLHVSEINGRNRQCRMHDDCSDHWTIRRRSALFQDLIKIIRLVAYRKFACIVVNRSFSEMSPDVRREFYLNAYSLAGRTCAARVREFIFSQWNDRLSPELIFEKGDRGHGKLIDRFEADGLGTPIFKSGRGRIEKDGLITKCLLPLQAADLFAYIVFDMMREYERSGSIEYSSEYLALNGLPTDTLILSPTDLDRLPNELAAITESIESLRRASTSRSRPQS